MRNRNLMLGRVAGAAFASSLIVMPCLAQSLPRDSTPAEQAQTDRLNSEQASEPAVIVSAPGAPSFADVATYNAQVAQSNAQAEAQYNAQLQAYQDKNNAYEAEKQGYQQRLDAYNNRVDAYRDRSTTYEDHSAVYDHDSRASAVTIDPGEHSLIALDDIANPDREIGGAPVEDRRGERVGNFRYLTFQDGNREKAVLTLRNNKSIALDDIHLRFDPDHETVIADLTYDELNSMPARF